MPRNGPPFGEAKIYFSWDAKGWLAINRPTWTTVERNTTIDTIWFGSAAVRAHYTNHRATTPGVLAAWVIPPLFPIQPYTIVDKAWAKANRALPGAPGGAAGAPGGGAQGGAQPVPPPVPPPGVVGGGLANIQGALLPGGGAAPVPGGQANAQPVLPVLPIQGIPAHVQALPAQVAAIQAPQQVPGQIVAPIPPLALISSVPPHYPFDFWPPQPWLQDPNTAFPTQQALLDDEGNARRDFLRSWGHSHPHRDLEETNWHGVKFLGAGSFGSAGLWVEIDQNHNILSRKVVKDTKPSRREWRDPTFWRNHRPREIHVHERVDARRPRRPIRETQNLIESYGSRVMMHRRRHRIYLKYYPGGDLETALGWEPSLGLATVRNNPLSEGFVWHVFESLISAVRTLQKGNHETDEPHWKPITHLDIAMRNIFIEEPRNDRHPRPTIVLSDFGLCIEDMDTGPNAVPGMSDNPHEYVGGHRSRTLSPPEHNSVIGYPPVRLSDKTDIWYIGQTIWNLMAGNPDRMEGPLREDLRDDTLWPVSWNSLNSENRMTPHSMFPHGSIFPQAVRYSPDLKTLVGRCLEYHARDRPTLDEVDLEINRFLNAHPAIRNDPRPPNWVDNAVEDFKVGNRVV